MESEDPVPLGDRNPDLPVKYHKPFNSKDWDNLPIPPAPKAYDTYTEKDKNWMYNPEENF
jgi:hypothetical protein